MTSIKPCNCTHAFQDKKYGKQMRVFNETLKGSGNKTIWRCTVCKNEKE